MAHRYTGRHRRRPTGRLSLAAVKRPTVVLAAAAAVFAGGIAPAAAHEGNHVVRPGDTLSTMATGHGTSWRAVYDANRSSIGADPNRLRVGQVVRIGGSSRATASAPVRSGTYVVRPGDTLGRIAARNGTSWQRLHALNRATIGANPNVLRVGQRLVLGGTAPRAAAATTGTAPQRASRAVRSSGDPRSTARGMVTARGWSGAQFSCLDRLWMRESGWNHRAQNPSSGAYGIPQALPASKMASAGSDWRSNPATQIRWGLGYIAQRYGTPCGAWNHFQAKNWY